MCREKHCESSSWLGNSTRWFVVHEHVNIHILRSLLWDCVHIAVCEKCLVRIEESVLLQVVCAGPLTCAVWIAQKKSFSFFFGVVRLGGVWRGGEMVHVSGGRGLHGVSEEGGVIWVQGSHSLGEKAVEQSGGAGSDAPVPSSWW